MHPHTVAHELEHCIKACTEAQDVCFRTLGSCLQKGGMRTHPRLTEALLSCGEICAMNLKLMLTGSEMAYMIAGACSQVAEFTATICDQYKEDLEIEHCAEVCRRCVRSCQRLEKSVAA